jgi:putative acetyltransferase
MLHIRYYRPEDAPALWAIFYAAVHETAAADYSPEQVEAWAPGQLDGERWARRIQDIAPFVAEDAGLVVGYADLQADGYIDHFFVAPSQGRRGVGSALMRHIHQTARERRIKSLYADVSLTAQPFFARWGFVIEAEQLVEVRGIALRNARMRKALHPASRAEIE